MKTKTNMIMVCVMIAGALVSGLSLAAPVYAAELVIADFNTGDKPNNLGGDFGSWDKDPNDATQSCEATFEYGDDASGLADGYAMRLTYDVDSANPAYNGFWMKLEGEDFSTSNTLNIHLKGDAQQGYTKRIKIEIKDYQKSASYVVNGITEEWQKFAIPFEKFKGISDWSSMNELVIVFDDINSSPKQGSVLVDHITITNE